MEILEYILRLLAVLGFCAFLIYSIWVSYKIFKSDKYLQVKQQYRNVEIAKADLKYEYKMAVLNYKSNRNTRQAKRRVMEQAYNSMLSMRDKFDIIDDNNYLNGEFVEFDPDYPYIIVTGERAIGKSQFSKVMSIWNQGMQYYSVQRFITLPLHIRSNAERSIIIRDIAQMENID